MSTIQSNDKSQEDSTVANGGSSSSSSVTITERARVIVSNNGSDESRFGYDKSSISIPSSSTDVSGEKMANNQEETKKKKKPANWLDVLQIDPKVYWPKKYRYTAEPRPGSYYMLTVKERDFYEDNGFLIVKSLIPTNGINKIRDNLKDGSRLASTDQPINSAITNDTLRNLINYPRIVRYAGSFCGYNIMAMTCSPIYDYMFSELQLNGFQRDLHCLPFRPADRIVSVWVALEPCGIELTSDSSSNGQVDYMIIPGSHRTGYLETIYSDDEGNKVRMFYERIPEVKRIRDEPSSKGVRKVQLKPGDALFYHPLLAYTIKINSQQSTQSSQGRLIAISCRYASSDCDYIETSSGSTYQDEIPPYLVNSISDYNLNKDYWRNQGLLIKGKRSNL